MITNFSLNIKTKITPGPPVLLIDCSPSMKNYLSEITQLTSGLNFKHKKLFFSDTVYEKQSQITVRFTNITNALMTARDLSPSAIILISDGNHNSGSSPLELLENFKVPIYCFGAGNTKLKDQAIVNIFYPRYAFRNDTVSVQANVEVAGMEKIGKIILSGEKIYLEKTFKLTKSLSRQSFEFYFVPQKSGNNKYKISLTSQPEEMDYNNNTYNFSIDVFERKISLLYYTDHPSANTVFITNFLKNNVNVELTQSVRVSEDKFITTGRIINQRDIDLAQFDIIIFDNIDGGRIQQYIKEYINNGKGLLISGVIRGTNEVLNEILPFRVTGTQLNNELPIKVLSPFSVFSSQGVYAPVSKINLVTGINPQTVLIAQAGDYPLVGYRQINRGVIFQINIPDIGLWHFAQLNLNNRDILTPLLEELIRFLSPYGRNQRLILETKKLQYHIGEKILLSLQCYNKNFTPGSAGNFYLGFRDKKIPFFEVKPGFYETTFTADTTGEFTISAQGYLNSDTLTSNKLTFNIIEIPSEPEELLNEYLLEEIARKTGGNYYPLSRLKEFQPPPIEYYETKSIQFDQPILYILICCLLILDWFIRKKGGLI